MTESLEFWNYCQGCPDNGAEFCKLPPAPTDHTPPSAFERGIAGLGDMLAFLGAPTLGTNEAMNLVRPDLPIPNPEQLAEIEVCIEMHKSVGL